MKKIKIIILRNELENDHTLWIKACLDFNDQLEFRVVDLSKNNWLSEIQKEKFDVLLAKPSSLTSHFKTLYDERIYILERCLGYYIFPSAEEIFIYENKRFLSFWLEANRIPHPKTNIFYTKEEALNYIKEVTFPIVAKTNIGASGSGVIILKESKSAINYTLETFEGNGAKQRNGPNLSKRGLLLRGFFYFFRPREIFTKLLIYQTRKLNMQKEFVLFQEFVSHDFEWRVVRIGDSFFAHKKLKIGEKASGSLLKEYAKPPFPLLDFVREITNKHGFFSQSIDVFEIGEEKYLVNEMQCVFGQSDPHQMLIDGIPGRFLYKENNWLFEPGNFNANESFNLRIKYILEKFKSL
jgi:hypothetical protein